jgi:hypothetical protein
MDVIAHHAQRVDRKPMPLSRHGIGELDKTHDFGSRHEKEPAISNPALEVDDVASEDGTRTRHDGTSPRETCGFAVPREKLRIAERSTSVA